MVASWTVYSSHSPAGLARARAHCQRRASSIDAGRVVIGYGEYFSDVNASPTGENQRQRTKCPKVNSMLWPAMMLRNSMRSANVHTVISCTRHDEDLTLAPPCTPLLTLAVLFLQKRYRTVSDHPLVHEQAAEGKEAYMSSSQTLLNLSMCFIPIVKPAWSLR